MLSPIRRALHASGALFLSSVVLGAMVLGGASPAWAETGKKALVLGSSVSGGAGSVEAVHATALGFDVTVVGDGVWGAMTAAQFADYQLLVVGDPTCNRLPRVVSQNATALADAVMARAGGNTRVGNRILIGTDPVFHRSRGGDPLIRTGLDFAGVRDGATNLYLTFSCWDEDWDGNGRPDGQDLLLPKLTIDPSATWTQNQRPPCGGSASLISNAAQFSTLSSSHLQGWFCSVHETFPRFPTDWSALAIATDTPTRPTCGTDVATGASVCGEAFVLIAGSGIVVESPALGLTPPTATNPVGTTHTVTATVTNPDRTPRPGTEVSFVVTGANAGAAGTCSPASCVSDSAGEVRFTYTGANEGEDTINAAITVDGSRQSATAVKTWEAPRNAPPVADAGGPYSAAEGGSTDLDGSGSSDPDGDALTHHWDMDGDGTFETPGSGPTFSAATLDDGVYPVRLRVCDPSGACDTDGAAVTVRNVPPTVDAGPDQTVFRNDVVGLSGSWTDPAGPRDAPYSWAWAVPGDDSAGTAPYGTTLARTAVFATEGSYTLRLRVTDDDGGTGEDELVVDVRNRAPSCADARADQGELWPPDHRFVPIAVDGLTDAEGDELTVRVTGIRQDEPVDTTGDGNTAPDGRGVDTSTAEVRAERSGSKNSGGNGRVYHVAFRASDGHGGACTGTVQVGVPHDRGGGAAIDDGPSYDSTAG